MHCQRMPGMDRETLSNNLIAVIANLDRFSNQNLTPGRAIELVFEAFPADVFREARIY